MPCVSACAFVRLAPALRQISLSLSLFPGLLKPAAKPSSHSFSYIHSLPPPLSRPRSPALSLPPPLSRPLARLRSELRSMDRLNNAVGNADTFEAVLAEEMHTMRESFEQKIASLKAQMERKFGGEG